MTTEHLTPAEPPDQDSLLLQQWRTDRHQASLEQLSRRRADLCYRVAVAVGCRHDRPRTRRWTPSCSC